MASPIFDMPTQSKPLPPLARPAWSEECKSLAAARIVQAVALHYGLSPWDLYTPCRKKRVSLPRHFAVWLIKKCTRWTYAELGTLFCRDHGTMINSVRSTEDRIATEPRFAAQARIWLGKFDNYPF